MVEIPDDVAKQYAAALRGDTRLLDRDTLADLLDPQPPSLDATVDAALAEAYRYWPGRMYPDGEDHRSARNTVLAVVADWLAAQPLRTHATDYAVVQRDHDVRLLRGTP